MGFITHIFWLPLDALAGGSVDTKKTVASLKSLKL